MALPSSAHLPFGRAPQPRSPPSHMPVPRLVEINRHFTGIYNSLPLLSRIGLSFPAMSQRLSCAVDSSLRPDSWAHLKFGKLLRIAALPCIFLVIYKPSALFVAKQHRRPPPCTPLSPTFHALRAPQRPRACDRRLGI